MDECDDMDIDYDAYMHGDNQVFGGFGVSYYEDSFDEYDEYDEHDEYDEYDEQRAIYDLLVRTGLIEFVSFDNEDKLNVNPKKEENKPQQKSKSKKSSNNRK